VSIMVVRRVVGVLLLAAMLSACATAENHYDPIEPVNRMSEGVNDIVDAVAIKPITQSYRTLTPSVVQRGVSNFYDNWAYMNTVLNDFLQGKGNQGFKDFGRFLVNSTVGIGGLFDVATSMGLEKHEEDFGQTLAVWGVGKSAYIVYPVFGPNSLRKTPDFVTSTLTDGLFWLSFAISPPAALALTAMKFIDTRSRAMNATDMRDELALDPYVFTREAWFQTREHLIHDGKVPASKNDDGWDDDDWTQQDTDMPSQLTISAPSKSGTIGARHGASRNDVGKPAMTDGSVDSAQKTSSSRHYYRVILSSHAIEEEALRQQAHLASMGILTRIVPVVIKGHRWFRVLLPEPMPAVEALHTLMEMKQKTGLNGAWIAPS